MRGLIAVAAIAAAMGLFACGETGEPAAPPITTAPQVPGLQDIETVADYNEAADELCIEAAVEQERLRRRVGGRQTTDGDRARLLVELGPVRELLGEDLAHLFPVPEEISREASELVIAARRRGVASTEAGRLHEEDGSKEKVAVQLAAEHDERLRFVAIARGMGMEECAEKLPRADVAEITAAAETALGDGPASLRCDAFGTRFLEETWRGGRDECVASNADGVARGDVEIDEGETVGIAGAFAQAQVSVSGTSGEVALRVRLTHEDGDWMIDKLD